MQIERSSYPMSHFEDRKTCSPNLQSPIQQAQARMVQELKVVTISHKEEAEEC